MINKKLCIEVLEFEGSGNYFDHIKSNEVNYGKEKKEKIIS